MTDAVKKLHPYDVPEVIAMEITGGSKDYLKWVDDSTMVSYSHKESPEKNEKR